MNIDTETDRRENSLVQAPLYVIFPMCLSLERQAVRSSDQLRWKASTMTPTHHSMTISHLWVFPGPSWVVPPAGLFDRRVFLETGQE